MEILANNALLVRTKNPNKVTEVISKSKVINEYQTNDGFGYEEDRRHEMECCECEKNFLNKTQH